MNGVFEFQLWLLTKEWQTLRKAQHASTKHTDLDQYCWKTLKVVHRMAAVADREKLALHMAGDYKRLSLNPRAEGFVSTGKAKGLAKATKAKAAAQA